MTADIIKPGQLVWAEYVWDTETKISTHWHGNLLCMYIEACYNKHRYHSYDKLLYGDRIVHTYPYRIRKFEEL